MVIYITDRHGIVLHSVASDLPESREIVSDKLADELASGVKIFECTLIATDKIRDTAITGNYVLAYGSLFTIMTSRFDTDGGTVELYCEDAGLDLINRIAGNVAKASKAFSGWIETTLGTTASSGWEYNYNIADTSKSLEYTSESTALERLLDILANYNAEMYFTYEIHGLKWVSRTINFVQKRGSAEKEHRLYLGKEVSSISEEKSIMDYANVWLVYGKDTTNLEKLSGYSSATKTFDVNGHHYEVVGSEVRCTDAINESKSKLDTDGRIVQVKYTDYSKAADAIAYAVRSMVVDTVYSYEVKLAHFPGDIQCGDYIYILDDTDNILLYARVLSWIRSETGNNEITLGDFVRLESSIADIDFTKLRIYSLQIESSSGLIGKDSLSTVLSVTVFRNGQAITEGADLTDGELHWYEDGVAISPEDSRISNDGFTFATGTLTAGHTYACRLEEVE